MQVGERWKSWKRLEWSRLCGVRGEVRWSRWFKYRRRAFDGDRIQVARGGVEEPGWLDVEMRTIEE
jgi:hypothetical protein